MVADEHFQANADVDLLDGVGKVASARYIQVQAARLMCIKQVALKEKENVILKEENAELKVKVSEERKDAEVSKKAHGFEMFAAAWDRAKAQANCCPWVSFEKMDPVKVVYNGELADDDQVPAEGSDDHNPAE
ncbi:hypothetical protein PIB30_091932 [Stylosanthes scabra]|uniref:Uncharacterized protein n=1 Tax=Stylosanthes scabra TaxID=79078 RepID=A0ABU6YSB9_9FABA|nr:hypothetical protein [Stylosanthes scabra]